MKRLARIARFINLILAASEKKQQHISTKYGVDLDIVKAMDKADPSGGKYLEWMANQVRQGAVEWPYDSKRTVHALQAFKEITLKKNLREQYQVSPDLNRYTLEGLETLASSFRGEAGPKPDSYRQAPGEGAKKIYDDGEYAILEVYTIEAACQFGQGTKWCTSGQSDARGYLEEAPLYVVYKNGQKYAQFTYNQDPLNLQDYMLGDPKLDKIIESLGGKIQEEQTEDIGEGGEQDWDQAQQDQNDAWETHWQQYREDYAYDDKDYQRESYDENYRKEKYEEKIEEVMEDLVRSRDPRQRLISDDPELALGIDEGIENKAFAEATAIVDETWEEDWEEHLDGMDSDFHSWALESVEDMHDEIQSQWEEGHPLEEFLNE